ncbi:MAG: hypothetical protein O3C68_07550, partial [Proteobacteria bacterium]|nr:hypothetical protein [Pseudomonadota bacterium]
MRQLLIAGLILLGSCSSQLPNAVPTTTIPTTTTKRFENQIAESILREVRESFRELEGTARVQFLQEKSDQFDRSVNKNLLASR